MFNALERAINAEPMIIPGFIAALFIILVFLFILIGLFIQTFFLDDWRGE
jgi:uncharacterized membrane protein YwzB